MAQVILDHGPVPAFDDLILHAIRIIWWRILEMDDQDAETSFMETFRFRGGHDGSAQVVGEAVDLVDALALHAAAGAFGVEVYLVPSETHAIQPIGIWNDRSVDNYS
jgi:hypothetical protein